MVDLQLIRNDSVMYSFLQKDIIVLLRVQLCQMWIYVDLIIIFVHYSLINDNKIHIYSHKALLARIRSDFASGLQNSIKLKRFCNATPQDACEPNRLPQG